MARLTLQPQRRLYCTRARADLLDSQAEINRQLEADGQPAGPTQSRASHPDDVLPSIEMDEKPDDDDDDKEGEEEEEAEEAEPEEAEEEDLDKKYEVEAITSFRRDESDPHTILLSTKWRGYPLFRNTWETELDLITEGAAGAVYAFWDSQGGRSAALGLDPRRAHFVAYRILRRVPAARVRSVLVQWLGYDEASATEETEKKMRTRAPELLRAFLAAEAAATGAAE